MLKHKTLIVLVLLGLLFTFAFVAVLAQDDGGMSDDYNWCFAGEPWGDGRCSNTGDPTLDVCMWEMGWYLPRVQAGLFTMEQVIAASSCVQCVNQTIVLAGSPYTGWYDIFINGDAVNANAFKTDTICGFAIYGNDQDNHIVGSSGNDTIFGYGGHDYVDGDSTNGEGYGNDIIYGGSGNDSLSGDSNDKAGYGNDVIYGGDGNDDIYGDSYWGAGSGDDAINGGAGDDTIFGDSLFGDGSGYDII
ncbi:MAG: calcium-binding protein, partial [Chloroflexi bacterium]